MSILNKDLTLAEVQVKLGKETILTELNLSLTSETIYTVLGPSGTGKSSLIKVIGGLLPISQGTLTYQGQKYHPTEQIIGLVPQNYGLLPWQTAWQAVSSAAKISLKQKKLTTAMTAELEDLFQRMTITELKNKYPHQMSGGQQQRVSIARAFAVKADFLLMDEPFSALDAFTREKAQQLFLDTWRQEPKTTLFITHDIDEAALLGQKIILMAGHPGKIVKVIDNPLTQAEFDLGERRNQAEFYQLVRQLRKELNREQN